MPCFPVSSDIAFITVDIVSRLVLAPAWVAMLRVANQSAIAPPFAPATEITLLLDPSMPACTAISVPPNRLTPLNWVVSTILWVS